jgi:outer membrane receptor protein involved in Fe transport
MNLGRPYLRPLFCVLLAAAPARTARAQAVYGSIAGTVTDVAGAALPGITLTITSIERQVTDVVTSDLSGNYLKDRLLAGLYEVRAERAGFASATAGPVRVSVDAQARVDFSLGLAQRRESVTVVAAELLKTARADVATTLAAREIGELTVLERNFTRFVLLTPGTQQLPWQHAASENPQGSMQTMVNGQHFGGTSYQLDGTDNRDPILGIIVINPTLESVGEAKVTSQNYDAEFGQATAGVVVVRTRSGTNEFHGSAFEYFRTDRLQARNPFTQPVGQPLPATTRHQFGGSLGGPIRKSTWFFFGDYEGLRSEVGGSRLLTVPTAPARAGDLSEYGIVVFDPETGPPGQRQPFPGNVIPAVRIAPQAISLQSFLPLPNRPGLRDNFAVAGSETFDGNAFNVRLDGRPAQTMNVFGRYSLAAFNRDGPRAFGVGGGPELVSIGGTATARNQSLALGADLTLNPKTVMDVRFGFFQYKVDVLAPDFGTTPARDAGLPGLNLDRWSSGLPSFFIEGPFGVTFGSGRAGGCNCPLFQDEKQFQLVANVTRGLGDHTLKAGVDVRRALNLRVPSDAHRAGELTFSENRTRGPEGGGLGLASFLLGDVSTFRRYVSSTTDARERQWRHFYYIQDTWRPKPRLTLSLGLRLDVVDPQTVNGPGKGGWLDLATGEIGVGGVGGIGLDGDVRNSPHWAPRLGVSYRPGRRTVLRAGYGRSYDMGVFGSTFGHSVTQNLPVVSVQELNPPENFERVFDLGEGPTPAVFSPWPPNGRFPLPNGVFAQALPPRMRLPAVDAYNVSVQHQLTNDLSLEAAYVGNKGSHTFAGDISAVDMNEPTIAGFPERTTDERRAFFRGPIAGIGGPFGWTQRIDFFCNCGDNRYDSLQAKLLKRFSRGYSLSAHYTLQRARQDGASQFFFDRELERGRPDWSRTHNFVMTALAELPVGRGRRHLSGISEGLDRLIGGWQVNAVVIVQSGLPFEVTYRDAGADRDTGPNRPNLIGDPWAGAGDGRTRPYFNVIPIGTAGSAFGRPAAGSFGNLRRNALTGPGYWRVDGSLFKRIRLAGRAALELRLEVVNLFNHVNLGNPDAEIGVPGNDNPNAGFINSTAYLGADPQRIVQLGARFAF